MKPPAERRIVSTEIIDAIRDRFAPRLGGELEGEIDPDATNTGLPNIGFRLERDELGFYSLALGDIDDGIFAHLDELEIVYLQGFLHSAVGRIYEAALDRKRAAESES